MVSPLIWCVVLVINRLRARVLRSLRQVYGRKLWSLVQPRCSQPRHSLLSRVRQSRLRRVKPGCEPRTVMQNAGDVLLIPRGWWHATSNVDSSISVATHVYGLPHIQAHLAAAAATLRGTKGTVTVGGASSTTISTTGDPTASITSATYHTISREKGWTWWLMAIVSLVLLGAVCNRYGQHLRQRRVKGKGQQHVRDEGKPE